MSACRERINFAEMEKEAMAEIRRNDEREGIGMLEINWNRYYRNVMFGLAMAVMLFCLAFGISASAMARLGREENNRYYLQQEQQLIKSVRTYLSTKGFQNSGVTVGRMILKDGAVEYTVTVHHGMINDLDKEERDSLLQALSVIGFDGKEASLRYEFLR